MCLSWSLQRESIPFCMLWRFQGLRRVFVSCSQVNLKAQHVEYNRFYIPDITSLVDIQEDYLKWFLSKAEIVSTEIPPTTLRFLATRPLLIRHTCSQHFDLGPSCTALYPGHSHCLQRQWGICFITACLSLSCRFLVSSDCLTSQTSLYNSWHLRQFVSYHSPALDLFLSNDITLSLSFRFLENGIIPLTGTGI